jgi:hypothetical protein
MWKYAGPAGEVAFALQYDYGGEPVCCAMSSTKALRKTLLHCQHSERAQIGSHTWSPLLERPVAVLAYFSCARLWTVHPHMNTAGYLSTAALSRCCVTRPKVPTTFKDVSVAMPSPTQLSKNPCTANCRPQSKVLRRGTYAMLSAGVGLYGYRLRCVHNPPQSCHAKRVSVNHSHDNCTRSTRPV